MSFPTLEIAPGRRFGKFDLAAVPVRCYLPDMVFRLVERDDDTGWRLGPVEYGSAVVALNTALLTYPPTPVIQISTTGAALAVFNLGPDEAAELLDALEASNQIPG
jgi:hypothetical protein